MSIRCVNNLAAEISTALATPIGSKFSGGVDTWRNATAVGKRVREIELFFHGKL